MHNSFKSRLHDYQQRIHTQLDQHLDANKLKNRGVPQRLIEALRYATLNKGKRLRPALLYAIGEALTLPLDRLDTAACAIELIHSYSLVHDDLPAMDNDDLRRGQPTCHIQYDEATAILVGDAQQTLAFELISCDSQLSDSHKIRLMQQLSCASGLAGMIGGQMIDMTSEQQTSSLEGLLSLHQMKTGALIEAALLMGAAQSPRYEELHSALKNLGSSIGLAFQVHDDILDIESDTVTLGKPQGSDQQANKATFPSLLGLEKAKHYRDALIQKAHHQRLSLKINSPFLQQLIDYIAERNH